MRRSLLLWVFTGIVAVLAVTCIASAGGGPSQIERAIWPSSDRSDPVVTAREALARADHVVQRATVAVDSASLIAHQASLRGAQALRVADRHRRRVRILSPTTLAVQLTPDGPPSSVSVPLPVVDRLQSDSTAIEALRLALIADDSLVAGQRSRISADSAARSAATTTIGALERTAHPRCGRRCGVAIGAVALLGAAIAVKQLEQLVSNAR